MHGGAHPPWWSSQLGRSEMFWANDFEPRKASISSEWSHEGNIGYETWLTSPALSHFTDNSGCGFPILTSVPFFPPVLNISLRLLWPVCVCGEEDTVTTSLCVCQRACPRMCTWVCSCLWGPEDTFACHSLGPTYLGFFGLGFGCCFCFVLRQNLSQTEILQTSQVGQAQGRCLYHPGFRLQLYCATLGYFFINL